ncbi:MAG TPA: (2Fe-2S) ferredoxin domain-containing protein [Anaerolineae bacterium]|nr:(2Fe-2S) ferredoxin domain-containing protein [Anaerolineae bacterium]HOR01013.1 (2Fe-2S) ferredoxin domain-containing protein [Anaerolineae bacterium]HPL28456.1 (2Fe-2S) ferredoxin domain-containing protein [Anaerolineae bacterium]
MVVVTVCVGSSCYVRGSDRVAEALQQLIDEHGLQGKVELSGAFCMEHCSLGVTVRVDDRVYCQVSPDQVDTFFANEIMPRMSAQATVEPRS